MLPIQGALFGLVFLAATLAGFGYRAWKDESIFKFQFLPETDAGQIAINIELPAGANLATSEQVVRRVEEVVLKNPEVKYAVSTLGAQGAGGFGGGGQTGSQFASISATLYDKAAILDKMPWAKQNERLRDEPANQVAADLLIAIGKVPGAKVTVTSQGQFSFGAPVQMSFRSEDRPLLQKTVEEIRRRLADGAIPGVINPDLSSKSGKPEIRFRPDRAALADAGVSVSEVGAATRTLYNGDDNTKLRFRGKEYDVRVMLDRVDRDSTEVIPNVPIKFVQGNPVYLGSLGTLNTEPGVDKIERRDRQEEIQLTADLLPGYAAGSVQAEIDRYIASNKLIPEGVTTKPLGQAQAQATEGVYLFGALGTGLVLVYLLLASLYNNWLYPFIIQLSQPQALVGALLALIITDKALNIIGFIGIICLVGLVGKNAILLVDYANTLRARGRNRHDALVEAGPTRLRPIMMTTIALILGILPVALAIGRGSEFRETIGITIIGGISLSTLLTLLVIPCSYTIFDDLSNMFSRWRGREDSFSEFAEEAQKEAVAS
jgi:HAE1 family hydrophobic/amphiphilic exporter-1